MSNNFLCIQLCKTGGPPIRTVEPRYSTQCPQRTAQRDEPEHPGQRMSPLTGTVATHFFSNPTDKDLALRGYVKHVI